MIASEVIAVVHAVTRLAYHDFTEGRNGIGISRYCPENSGEQILNRMMHPFGTDGRAGDHRWVKAIYSYAWQLLAVSRRTGYVP